MRRGGLPRRVKVGHLTYRVSEMDRKTAERSDIYGDMVASEASIRVKAGMAPGATAETLMHEIFHAIYDEWAIKSAEDNEERLVDAFSKGMVTVMRDNPDVVRWFMSALRAG